MDWTIALLAGRPVRLRNLAQIEVGRHLQKMGDAYWLFFDAQDIKNRRSLEFPLPKQLTQPMQHYMNNVRPELREQHGRWKTDVDRFLWVGEGGSELKAHRIGARICRRTEGRFGHPISPHLFRDAAATSIAELDPEHVGTIKAILGHASLATSEIYYRAYPSEPGLTTCWVSGCHRRNVRLMFCHSQPLEVRPPDVPRRLRGALSR